MRHTGSSIKDVLTLDPDLRNAVWHRLKEVLEWEREQQATPAPAVHQNLDSEFDTGWRTD